MIRLIGLPCYSICRCATRSLIPMTIGLQFTFREFLATITLRIAWGVQVCNPSSKRCNSSLFETPARMFAFYLGLLYQSCLYSSLSMIAVLLFSQSIRQTSKIITFHVATFSNTLFLLLIQSFSVVSSPRKSD